MYDYKLTIVWITYYSLADHIEIMCEILYDYYGVILWADYVQPGQKTWERRIVQNYLESLTVVIHFLSEKSKLSKEDPSH